MSQCFASMEHVLLLSQMHEPWTYHYSIVREHLLSAVPFLIRPVLGYYIYRKVQSALHSQGTGRLTDAEIKAAREEIWESISILLQTARDTKRKRDDAQNSSQEERNGPFWALGESEQGSHPSEVDAALFASVASTMVSKAYVSILPLFYVPQSMVELSTNF